MRWRSSAVGPTAGGRPCRWPTPAAATCSNRKASTPGASGISPSGTCWPSTCARASSTPSSAAPPTPATWSSAGCSRRSWRPTCRSSKSIRFGHPLAVRPPADPLPDLDFGPVIHATKAADLGDQWDEAIRGGGIPLYRGSVGDGAFLDAQDTSAYVAPACVLQPPAAWSLHHAEPFGPIDSVVVVDTESELLAAMNASNGSLVGSIATDDPDFADRVAEQLQSFKVGINKPRSRGDREEVFGGLGHSWKGAFVGGDLLVQAVTYGPDGPDEQLYGNFPGYSLLPHR